MYINAKDEIRKELKDMGITSRQVGIREKFAGYSSIIYVKIKDVTINIKDIEEICNKYESIRWDEASGEILRGGNTYIEISYDYEAMVAYQKENNIMAEAEKIYNAAKQESETQSLYQIYENDSRFLIDIENHDLIIEDRQGHKKWNLWDASGLLNMLTHYKLNHYEPLETFKAFKEEQQKQFEIDCKKREEERKQIEEEQKAIKTQRQKDVESINKNSIFEELPENEQQISAFHWANMNKNDWLDDYLEQEKNGEYYNRKAKITHKWTIKNYHDLETLRHNLLTDFEQLRGLGGTYSDDPRLDQYENSYSIPREIIDSVEWVNLAVAVVYNDKLQFVIDPQGFSYARYVGLPILL